MPYSKSEALFQEACKYMPGGVSSPVRAFKAVEGHPLFIHRAQGSKLYDVDGNEYIDYVSSFGPLILGHAHPVVLEAIAQASQRGTSYGTPCEAELELAKTICSAFPAIDKIRMVNSGTEATMSAIRLARAATGRDKIVKFEGCYHGHGDSFLIQSGSGLLTAGIPTSPGVPQTIIQDTLLCRFNDPESVSKTFEKYGNEIAAVIVEPIPGNMGLVLPQPGFLEGLREITRKFGSLLIFDEVITGFRVCYGGMQTITGISPDLTTLGKIIGGGLPVGAYGGRKDLMDMVAPEGPVYQAGTLSGNPLAMSAGLASLHALQDGDLYDRMDVVSYYLCGQLQTLFEERGWFYTINRVGSMFTIFFTEEEINSYADVKTTNTEQYARFHGALLEQGVYFPPSQFEVCFVSAAHELEDADKTIAAVKKALETIK